jgi:hypothetical protein
MCRARSAGAISFDCRLLTLEGGTYVPLFLSTTPPCLAAFARFASTVGVGLFQVLRWEIGCGVQVFPAALAALPPVSATAVAANKMSADFFISPPSLFVPPHPRPVAKCSGRR